MLFLSAYLQQDVRNPHDPHPPTSTNDSMRGSFFVAKEIHNFTFAASVQQLGFGLSANCSFPSGTNLPMILEKLRPNHLDLLGHLGYFEASTWKYQI